MYQVYNPRKLRADFLYSVMPTLDWLFSEGGKWVDRDPLSPKHKHVYLYGECESKRTVVYYASTTIVPSAVQELRKQLNKDEILFRRGELTFNLLSDNCSSIIAAALSRANLVEPRSLHCIPAFTFKDFVRSCAWSFDVEVGKLAMYDRSKFEPHGFCIGAGVNPEKNIDRWLVAESTRWTP